MSATEAIVEVKTLNFSSFFDKIAAFHQGEDENKYRRDKLEELFPQFQTVIESELPNVDECVSLIHRIGDTLIRILKGHTECDKEYVWEVLNAILALGKLDYDPFLERKVMMRNSSNIIKVIRGKACGIICFKFISLAMDYNSLSCFSKRDHPGHFFRDDSIQMIFPLLEWVADENSWKNSPYPQRREMQNFVVWIGCQAFFASSSYLAEFIPIYSGVFEKEIEVDGEREEGSGATTIQFFDNLAKTFVNYLSYTEDKGKLIDIIQQVGFFDMLPLLANRLFSDGKNVLDEIIKTRKITYSPESLADGESIDQLLPVFSSLCTQLIGKKKTD